jgi:hypothetical protein
MRGAVVKSAGLLFVVFATVSCGLRTSDSTTLPSSPGAAVISELKEFQQSLGVDATRNFLRYSDRTRAVNRCYFTGRLELPATYADLQLTADDERRCAAREAEFDVFFYPIEAVASGRIAVTPALAEAAVERVLVVVPHEDFHNQRETRGAPPDVAEAAATLIGFLVARSFARDKYGESARVSDALDREARLFAEKARIVNRHFDDVSTLYEAFRSRQITREAALARKKELFADLQRACSAIAPAPVSFNRCPAAMNNAGLAFDRTYTRHYSMVYDLHMQLQQDAKATIAALKELLKTSSSAGLDGRQ